MTTTQRGNKSTITVGTTQVELFADGSGPALVFLHGAGGNAGWQPWHEDLSKHYTVYVPSQPGFNGTERPAWVYTITDVSVSLDAASRWTATRDSRVTLVGATSERQFDARKGVTITAIAGQGTTLKGKYTLASGGVLNVKSAG